MGCSHECLILTFNECVSDLSEYIALASGVKSLNSTFSYVDPGTNDSCKAGRSPF